MASKMSDCWTVIVLTSSSDSSLNVVENELKLLKTKGCISSHTEILGIQDPSQNLGSGAATLNALYTVTEYLSALNDYATFNTDVLKKAKVLIIHCGRNYIFESGNLKALITFNQTEPNFCGKDKQFGLEPIKNLEHLIHLVTEMNTNSKTNSLNLGVWVCSTDMSLKQNGRIIIEDDFDWNYPTIISVETDIENATRHGTICYNEDGLVENIIYCGSEESLKKCSHDDKVNIVCGIVYLPIDVAEDMLIFNSITPLNRCTYMGLDSGGEPLLQVSLFFDILVAMCSKVTKEDFIGGNCGKLYELKLHQNQRNAIIRARTIVWSSLSKYDLKMISLKNCEYLYWDDRLNCETHIKNLRAFLGPHSTDENFLINSYVKSNTTCKIGINSAICHSYIKAKNVEIGSNCYLCGVNWSSNDVINIPDGTVIVGFHTSFDINEKQYVILGIRDSVQLNLNNSNHPSPLVILAQIMNVKSDDKIENVKIFPKKIPIQELWEIIQSKDGRKSWNGELLSMRDIMENVNFEMENEWRRNQSKRNCLKSIVNYVKNDINTPLIHFFKPSVVEGWALEILDTLEDLALNYTKDYAKLCRILSSIADLLGSMAGNLGKIRSGPGNNKSWENSFSFLRNGEIEKGLIALKTERKNWMGRNDLIVRAARHYERALQILIQNAVVSVKEFIKLEDGGNLCEMGQWVTAECPARADLQGGWTDTPPICYELKKSDTIGGGSVVNVALLVDGKKPIGAKCKRIPEYKIIFKTLNNQSDIPEIVEINIMEDLLDYNEPSSPAALLKAAIITTNVISLSSDKSLKEQLNLIQSGLEILLWSCLPQGSGLGTSSILASAVIAVIWTTIGKIYTKNSLLHAVLYLEQLMTTGGGWQDQVGGVMGGINRGFSLPQLPLKIGVEKIRSPQIQDLNDHLLLIYTGKVRLAKYLLQNVIRNWYAREENIVNSFQMLLDHSLKISDAIREGNLIRIGKEMNVYWEIKKVLAPGCDPIVIRQLMQILEDKVLGQILVGAGGGGFMCVLTKNPNQKLAIQKEIKKANMSETITVHTATIDTEGILVKIGEKIVNLSD